MSYTSSDIIALSDLESIRTRAGMYIGDTNDPHQLLIEATDNGLDECQAGFSSKIVVNIDTKLNKYSVRDYGRGIPIGKSKYHDSISNKDYDIETLQMVYFKNHAGGKFGGSAYKTSRGLHGVGAKAINALSSELKVITIRDKKSVELRSSKGKLISLEYKDTNEPNGVYLEFIPDTDIFDTIKIPNDKILEICSIPKAFGLNVELYIDNNKIDLPYNNIYDLIPSFDKESELLKTTFKVNNKSNGESMILAIKYTSDTNTIYRGYTNMIYNSSGGSHLRFFEDCYREAWNKYLDNEFKIQDVFIGLRALVGVSIDNEQMAFSSQTKERLTTNKSYFDQFKDELVKQLQDYFDTHDNERKGLIKRFKEYRASQNKLLANKTLSDLIYINNNSNQNSVRRKSVVDKLRECTNKSQKGTHLIITEGDSACGTLVRSRDVRYHALLPIRGKILNVSKRSSLVECMKNEEIRSIVNSAGAGIGSDCDHTKSRYESYWIMCDSDEDGYNIASLLISIFVNLMPDIVKSGMLYVVHAPLYAWTDHGVRKYTDDLSEVKDLKSMNRFKGLGEMDPDEMRESCLDPNNQKLIQVEYPTNIDDFNQSMTSSQLRYKILEGLGLIKEIV